MSALSDAIGRSFSASGSSLGSPSPMRVLGRRQLSGYEVFAQSVATTAPTASMVIVPATLLTTGALTSGLLVIVGIVSATVLAAYCVSQFTRRMVSPGGLYSFACQGLGSRGGLLTGAAILLKYLASASMTLYHGSVAVSALLTHTGVVHGSRTLTVCICLIIAALLLATLVRGARVAGVAILAIEACSLIFIVAVMALTSSSTALADVHVAPSTLPFWLVVVFSLVGFESATFLGTETQRPYRNVTRTVLATPAVCGALLVLAAVAAGTGHAGAIAEVYLTGGSSQLPAWVAIAVQMALAFSWLASAMASTNAASRVVFSMGVDGVAPRLLATVHSRFRTPSVAMVALVTVVASAAALSALVDPAMVLQHLQPAARIGVVIAYLCVAAAALAFLIRIGEDTLIACCACVAVIATCTTALVGLVFATWDRPIGSLAALCVLVGAVSLWWLGLRAQAPQRLYTMGAFDRADAADALPGAVSFGPDTSGALVLVANPRPPSEP